MPFNTRNPIPSGDLRDLDDNARNIDTWANDKTKLSHPDRFGVERYTWHGIEKKADDVIANLGFFPPVDYTTGLNVDSRNFTVTYNGVVYAAQPSAVPFTTGAWDDAQWYPIQNILNQKNLLVFDTYAEASTAAATLPDGQHVAVEDSFLSFTVSGGVLGDVRPSFPPGIGVSSRSQQVRNADLPSVADFVIAGEEDHTAAFARAVAFAKKFITSAGVTTFPRAPMCQVFIPAGDWVLGSMVDTGGADVIYEVSPAARITNPYNANGTLARVGEKVVRNNAYGLREYATAFSSITGGTSSQADKSPGLTGLASPSGLGTYTNRDIAGSYTECRSVPAIADTETATYTATTITLPNPIPADQLKRLRAGMIIDTKHEPRCSGAIESWSEDGMTITVKDGWFAQGSTTPVTPSNGIGAIVNCVTAIWGLNTTTHLLANMPARRAIAHEYSLYNYRKDFDDRNLENNSETFWGVYSSMGGGAGYYKGQAAFICSGPWKYGYAVRGLSGVDVGFHYQTTLSTGTGFSYKGGGTVLEGMNNIWQTTFSLGSNGNIVIGNNESVSTKYIDFKTSGNTLSYDCRIQVSGGTTAVGNATFTLACRTFRLTGADVVPNDNNTRDIGAADRLWANIRAANGTIVTSDAREKTAPEQITDDVLDAWGDVQLICFQWLAAIQAKGGDVARWHFGVIAQQVRDAFAARGLDATRYGLLCYDEWVAKDAVLDEDGNVVEPAQEAGNRWGIRADQCLFLEAAYQRRRADRIEARLAAIEATLSLNGAA